MKKSLFAAIAALSITAGAAFAAQVPQSGNQAAAPHKCAECLMRNKAGAKNCPCKMSPEKLPGVTTAAANTRSGSHWTRKSSQRWAWGVGITGLALMI